MPAGSMGKRVSKFEAALPRDAVVRLVRSSPEEGIGEVDVHLDSFGPAVALRDVATRDRAGGFQARTRQPDEDNPFAQVRSASVSRVHEQVLRT